MNYKKLYPLTIPLVKDHPELMSKIFLKVRPHKEGSFIGVSILDGSFYVKDREEVYNSLTIGERLNITVEGAQKVYSPPLIVSRLDGTELGYISKNSQVILNMLLERGVHIFAYCEAKSYHSDILTIAVSVYCEKY